MDDRGLFLCRSVRLPLCQSVYLSVCRPVSLQAHRSVYPSDYLAIYLSVCIADCLPTLSTFINLEVCRATLSNSIYTYICSPPVTVRLPGWLSVSLPLFLSLSLSICLTVYLPAHEALVRDFP